MVLPLTVPVHHRMIVIPRPLRLTFYSLLIIAGALLAAALATRHAERVALVDDAARANRSNATAPCPPYWPWTRK